MSTKGHRPLRVLAKAVGILVAVVFLLLLSLHFVVHSDIPARLVEKLAARYVDGDFSMSGLKVRTNLSMLNIDIDTLRVTYPHERFSEYDNAGRGSRMLQAGRNEAADTLLSFNSLSIRFNLDAFLQQRRLQVQKLHLEGLRGFVHKYDDGVSNLSVIKIPAAADTSRKTNLKLAIEDVGICGPRVVYTDQCAGVFVASSLDSLALDCRLRLSSGTFDVGKLRLAVDSLRMRGRLPKDTLGLRVDRLRLNEPGRDKFDLELRSNALARTNSFGRLDIPMSVDAGFDLKRDGRTFDFDFTNFDANVAYVPISATGAVHLGDDVGLDVAAKIDRCPLKTIFEKYSTVFPSVAEKIYGDGLLSVDATLDGTFGKSTIPDIRARVQLPASHFKFKARALDGIIDTDLSARLSPKKKLDVSVHKLKADGDSFHLDLVGKAEDLLGKDPFLDVDACLKAGSEQLVRSLGLDIPVKVAGDIDFDLKGNARLSEIRQMSFQKTSVGNSVVGAHLTAPHLYVTMDTVAVRAYAPDIRLSSGEEEFNLLFSFDSVYFKSGDAMAGRLRKTTNSARMSMQDYHGTLAPRIQLSSNSRRAFFKTGPHRFLGRSLHVNGYAQQRVSRTVPDSLKARMDSSRRRASVKEDELSRGDIDISLDTSRTRLLKSWKFVADASLLKGAFASPVMPLRTSFDSLALHYDGNNLKVDTLGIRSGTSDLGLKGSINGLGRALTRKGRLDLDMDIDAGRINLNEILAAFEIGDKDEENKLAEEDNSFVVDSLTDVIPELPPMELVIVPANVNANLDANVGQVDFTYFTMDSVRAHGEMKDRMVLLKDSGFLSDYGSLSMDAFYSTQSKEDISAGVTLKMNDVDADQIISVLPSVDSLMPALKTFKGFFDCDVAATTQLDSNMNVKVPSLEGVLRIQGRDLSISDAGKLRGITSLLLFKDRNIGHIDDLEVSAVAHDSKLEIFPFELSVDRYKMALWGMQGLDRSIYYHVSILKAPLISRFGVNFFGTLDNWRFGLTSAKYQDGQLPTFTSELDEMQINISDYVRDVFRRGVKEVNNYNKSLSDALAKREREVGFFAGEDSDVLSKEEYNSIDASLMELQLDEEERLLNAEIDAILEESFEDNFRVMQEYLAQYQDEVYDKRVLRKMERMKNREARKRK